MSDHYKETIEQLRRTNEKLKDALDGDVQSAIEAAFDDGAQYGSLSKDEISRQLGLLTKLLVTGIGPFGTQMIETSLDGRTVVEKVTDLIDRYRRSQKREQDLRMELNGGSK